MSKSIAHQFVRTIPDHLEEGTLYISLEYGTASHRCVCGCGTEVVTPLTPTDWWLIFDGETVTLHPSIGNWSLPCRSHYFIRNNRVEWAPRWSEQRIADGRALDRWMKHSYFRNRGFTDGSVEADDADGHDASPPEEDDL